MKHKEENLRYPSHMLDITRRLSRNGQALLPGHKHCRKLETRHTVKEDMLDRRDEEIPEIHWAEGRRDTKRIT